MVVKPDEPPKELNVRGGIILKWIFERPDGVVMEWTGMAEDWDLWRTFVNTVINIRVS
jgi:hypothetical protein